jgi:predicted small secreted protein
MDKLFSRWSVLLVLAVSLTLAGCQTLREVTALKDVKFAIDRVAEANLAGIPVEQFRDRERLSVSQMLQISQAVQAGELPLDFTLHVSAENPPDNSVQARLVKLDWSLFLNEQETIEGVFDSPTVLPPGEPQDVAIPVRVDLVRFFGRNVRDLVDLSLAIAGVEGHDATVALEAQPTVQTAIGPIRYPNPITIVRRDVGAAETP